MGLGAGLVWAITAQGDSPATPQPTLVAGPGSTSVTEPPATVTIPTSPTSTSLSPSEPATTPPPSAPPVVTALQEALAAWGEFAVTGAMADLGGHFVAGGPQRRLLRDESAAIRENPAGPPAYEVTTSNVFSISVTDDNVVLRAEVVWERLGEATQEFLWDIQMRRVDDRWQLLTVEDVTGSG